MSATLVIAAGHVPDRVAARCTGFERVIAADSGVATVRRLELAVTEVVGDLDSASPDDLAWAEAQGASIVEYPSDKDATDLELALDRAIEGALDEAAHVVVIGVEGGRTDHVLGNWSVIVGASSRADVEVWTDSATVHVVTDRFAAATEAGRLVSLVPWGGAVSGVTTWGLRWPLHDAELFPTRSHGVSNVAVDSSIGVTIEQGTLLVAIAEPG